MNSQRSRFGIFSGVSRAGLLALGAYAASLPLGMREASAEAGERLPKIARLRDEAAHADGARAYSALRKLWEEWDFGDPSSVEEALDSLAHDARIAAPTRAYAGLLEAYARRRRGDLDGAKSRVARLGFVGRWLVAGPFDNEGKAGLDRAFGPEEDRAEPINLGRTYDGKERPVRWRVSPSTSPYGWVDFGALVRPTAKTCSYATTFVHDTREKAPARSISLWVGDAGAMRVFWNGAEVLKDELYRDLDADRFAAHVELKSGWNRLLVKSCGDDDAPLFTLRLADEQGAPDAHLEADTDPSHSIQAAAQRYKKGDAIATKLPPADGPIPTFERRVASNDPAIVEAYARYLVDTDGDDDSVHRARELAVKAAEKAPTIARLLLAGSLAEGRNQRAAWIEKAEALAAKHATRDERIDVLLARAAHERGGVNWRDAVPYFDRVLALDPDNAAALLARVELYSEAGLRETAIDFLQKALARSPRSVALMRALAAALREEDRSTEADEVEERYAALRFDSPQIASAHVELAIAKRDQAAAARWIDRLLAVDPENAQSLASAAHVYELFGDRPRAVAMLRHSLDLAPEDTDAMRALADVYARGGQTDDQLKLLRRVLEITPQAKDVREYVAHTEPAKPRADELYARPASEFLKRRGEAANGFAKRTFVDLQVTTVFPNGLASRFHQVVFQPLTEAAAAEAREYAFGFESDSETVQLRGAHVYRVNGQTDEAIESGEGPADNPSIATYTSERAFYVHFPRLHPGDVVELQYRVEDVAPRNAFADYFGEVDYMQSSDPIGRAEYVLITPKTRSFFFNESRVPGLTKSTEETRDSRIYRFIAENVAPILPEAEQPPYPELLGHVHVSTYKSWDDLGRWYWGLVKDQFVADDEVRRRVNEITKGKTTDLAKVQAVYDYVVQKTRYVALEFGIHGFKPYRCPQIFARGFGDCKDKATLIVTMLKELGIPATITIVRTGHRGDFETEPASLAPFDHAIAYVPSLDLYLDGTAENTGSSELPAMDRGALALQINEGHPKLVHLPDPPASMTTLARKIDVTLGADGSALLDWRADVAGATAGAWRDRYHAEATRRSRLQEDMGAEFAGFEIASLDANDMENVEAPVMLHARGKVHELARLDGDAMSVAIGPGEHYVRDYASLSQRRLDVRIEAQTTTVSDWTVKIPAGTHLTSSPHPAKGESPFGNFTVDVEQTPTSVHLKATIVFTKTRIPASEYPAFRAYCEQLDRALGQRVSMTK